MSPTSCHCSTPHRGADYTTRTRGRQGIRLRAPVISLKIQTIAQSPEPHYNRPWCRRCFFICDVCLLAFLHSRVVARVT